MTIRGGTSSRVLAVGACAAVAAVVLGGASASGSPGTTTLSFTARGAGGSQLDNAPKGPSVGDQFFEHGSLRSSSGAPAGDYVLVSQLIAGNAEHGQEQTSLTLHLKDGSITTLGGIPTEDNYSVPVVGGTGRYRTAAGVLSVRPGAGDTEHLTITLQN